MAVMQWWLMNWICWVVFHGTVINSRLSMQFMSFIYVVYHTCSSHWGLLETTLIHHSERHQRSLCVLYVYLVLVVVLWVTVCINGLLCQTQMPSWAQWSVGIWLNIILPWWLLWFSVFSLAFILNHSCLSCKTSIKSVDDTLFPLLFAGSQRLNC
jgi:hypothetical protein